MLRGHRGFEESVQAVARKVGAPWESSPKVKVMMMVSAAALQAEPLLLFPVFPSLDGASLVARSYRTAAGGFIRRILNVCV